MKLHEINILLFLIGNIELNLKKKRKIKNYTPKKRLGRFNNKK